jgi:hypothetical protein
MVPPCRAPSRSKQPAHATLRTLQASPRIVDAARSPRWWDGEGRKARNSRRTAECAAITLAAFREPERRVTSGDHCTARFAHSHHRSLNDGVTVNVWCRCRLGRQGTAQWWGMVGVKEPGSHPMNCGPHTLWLPARTCCRLQEKKRYMVGAAHRSRPALRQ